MFNLPERESQLSAGCFHVMCPSLCFYFPFHALLQKTASLFTGLPWLLSSGQWDADGQLFGCWHWTRLVILVGTFCFCLDKKWSVCFREGFISCQVTVTALSPWTNTLVLRAVPNVANRRQKWLCHRCWLQLLVCALLQCPTPSEEPQGPGALPSSQDEQGYPHSVTSIIVLPVLSWPGEGDLIILFASSLQGRHWSCAVRIWSGW